MIWAEEVIYTQTYPVERKCAGWAYREKVYSMPMSNAVVGTDGKVPPRQMTSTIYVCIHTDHSDPFKQNIQRKKSDVIYTGKMMPLKEFEAKRDKVSMLMREWQ